MTPPTPEPEDDPERLEELAQRLRALPPERRDAAERWLDDERRREEHEEHEN